MLNNARLPIHPRRYISTYHGTHVLHTFCVFTRIGVINCSNIRHFGLIQISKALAASINTNG